MGLCGHLLDGDATRRVHTQCPASHPSALQVPRAIQYRHQYFVSQTMILDDIGGDGFRAVVTGWFGAQECCRLDAGVYVEFERFCGECQVIISTIMADDLNFVEGSIVTGW